MSVIQIGEGIVNNPDCFLKFFPKAGAQVMVVTDDCLAPLYLDNLLQTLRSISTITQIDSVIIPHGEHSKTLALADFIFTELIHGLHDRETTLIALGGGMIGDLTGFCAACYLRGVNFIQVPTSLLAQVDASIGGKTGVNHALGKNLIGAFYPPKGIICDLLFLQSLSQREFIGGLAEVLKYGIALNLDFFEWVEKNRDLILAKNSSVLSTLVEHCVQIKTHIVAQDLKETGGKRIYLNFGHTVGHALESVLVYQGLSHGEAVSIGMVAALLLSQEKGILTSGVLDRVKKLLDDIGLPVSIPKNQVVTIQACIEAILRDKKKRDHKRVWVLLKELGSPVLESDVSELLIRKVLGQIGGQL